MYGIVSPSSSSKDKKKGKDMHFLYAHDFWKVTYQVEFIQTLMQVFPIRILTTVNLKINKENVYKC